MSTELPVTQAREQIAEITSRAQYTGETVYLTKHGKRTSAVVSASAAEALEAIEDFIDRDEVRDALDAVADGTDTPEPFERRTCRDAE